MAPEGGLFLVAKPKKYFGKTFSYRPLRTAPQKEQRVGRKRDGDGNAVGHGDGKVEEVGEVGLKTVTLDADTVVEAMHASVGVCINGSNWACLPGYCRFVISLPEAEWEEGLKRIREFDDLVCGK